MLPFGRNRSVRALAGAAGPRRATWHSADRSWGAGRMGRTGPPMATDRRCSEAPAAGHRNARCQLFVRIILCGAAWATGLTVIVSRFTWCGSSTAKAQTSATSWPESGFSTPA